MRARLQEKLRQRNLNTEHQEASGVAQQQDQAQQQAQEHMQEETNKENNNTNN